MSYKVTAPLVIIPNGDGSSSDWYGYEGAVVPSGHNDERCKQLVKEGFLEKVKEPEPDKPASSGDADKTPAKNASLETWQAFATSKGATEADLDGKTRDDLVAAYGS